MPRRKGQAHKPGVADKIAKGVKAHYAENPRTEAHNQAISAGRKKQLAAKRGKDSVADG